MERTSLSSDKWQCIITSVTQETYLHKQSYNSYAVLLPYCLINAAVQCGVPVH